MPWEDFNEYKLPMVLCVDSETVALYVYVTFDPTELQSISS